MNGNTTILGTDPEPGAATAAQAQALEDFIKQGPGQYGVTVELLEVDK